MSNTCAPRYIPKHEAHQSNAVPIIAGRSHYPRLGEVDLNTIRKRLFNVLFGGGRAGRILDLWLLAAILVSVSVVMMHSVASVRSEWFDHLRAAEIAFTVIFSLEYLLRLFCHPQLSRYALGFFGLVDLISIAPTWLEFVFPGWDSVAILRVLRMFRIVRILSLGRFSRAAMTLGNALQAARYKVAAFLIGATLTSVVAGSLMYLVEGPQNGFTSIPASTYWAIITMTTVGHGSLMPATVLGQILTSLLVILGYAVVAIPIGVITSEVLAGQKVREALLEGEETERREFKSSAFHSYKDAQIPQKVIFEASSLKPVAGFLNGRGGFLFIGVDDNGNPLGIQPDLEAKGWTTEKFVRNLTAQIGQQCGSAAATCTHISIETFRARDVCIIEIDPSPDPVWLLKAGKSGKREVFYVRTNNATRELSGPDLVSYLRKRWD